MVIKITFLDSLATGAEATLGAPERMTPTLVRLVEMGLVAGKRVRLTRRAPLGDPLEVLLVGGPRLCLRKSEASAFPVRDVEVAP